MATYATVHGVQVLCKAELHNNAALIVQIYINCEEKRSYLQQDVSTQLEEGYAVIFHGFGHT